MLKSSLLLLALLFPLSAEASLEVSSYFGDHMVLQREQTLPVWGKADPGKKVTVKFRDNSVNAQADAEGRWQTVLPPQSVGEPGTLQVTMDDQTIAFKDVLVGEVWICSGQSNMQWPVSRAVDAEAEIAAANYPSIRLLNIPHRYSTTPVKEIDAKWQVCSPQTVGSSSAVGYYFGRDLWKELKVPIGLVSSNWGGTPAEAWTPLKTLESNPAYTELVAGYQTSSALLANNPDLEAKMQKDYDSFMERAKELITSPQPPSPEWFDPEAKLEKARTVRSNTPFLKETDGLAQLRDVFSLTPTQAAAGGARIRLGQIDNYDAVWINEVQVGKTGLDTPDEREYFRDYAIPDGTLHPGKNVVVLQIMDWHRDAFFGGNIESPQIVWPEGDSIALHKDWQMELIVNLGPRPDTLDRKMRNTASFLFNGMIAPIVPTAFRGVIWYQGEANTTRAEQYRTLFPEMIAAWRKAWNRGPFPFYFVQLANFNDRDGWPELREAQRETLAVPNTGMAVTIDIGDPGNIHPKNKQDVGKRLALWALADTYDVKQPKGQPIPHSGPLFLKAEVEDRQIRLSFDHVDGGLSTSDGEPLKGFTIAGEDGTFLPAQARVEEDVIVVSHPEIKTPRQVRYAWAINPEANLINGAGLPASPFQTEEL